MVRKNLNLNIGRNNFLSDYLPLDQILHCENPNTLKIRELKKKHNSHCNQAKHKQIHIALNCKKLCNLCFAQ